MSRLVLMLVCSIHLSLAATAVATDFTGSQFGAPSANIQILPEAPKAGGPLDFTVNGNWPDSCVPELQSTNLSGNVINIEAVANPQCGGCLTVIRAYEVVTAGGVAPAAGTYTVNFNVTRCTTRSTFASRTFVIAAQIPPSISFSASPAAITPGQSSTLSWTVQDATSVSISPGIGPVATSGSRAVTPAATTTYTLTATGPGGTRTATATVTVLPPPQQPRILSFRVTPQRIRAGQQVVLTFETVDASSVVIDGIGALPPSGLVVVSPASTTTFTLRATSGLLSVSQSVTVEVIVDPAVSVSAFPESLVQEVGRGGATTTYSLTNSGGAPTTITLARTASFFTQSPESFTLERGATQVVTIISNPSTAGLLLGASVPFGAGVPPGLQIPIRLLSADPPPGLVVARFGDTRLDTFAPANVNPTGTARITNSGTATLSGSVSADVPWITPSTLSVTIAPGATANIGFTIDRSRRNDSDELLGSASGNLSISYLSATGAGKGAPRGDQAPGSSVNVTKVTVVDTVPPPTGTGAPPPLGAGEVALFLSGLGHVQSSVGLFISDLSLGNPGNRAINDIRFFYTATTAPTPDDSKTADVPLASSRSITLGDVVKTTFGQDTQGTLQVRSNDATSLVANASVFNTSNPAGTYGTAIPTIRSDRAAGADESIVLTGLRSDASTYTNFYLQEVSGSFITVQTEFFSADGSSLGTRSDELGPFRLKQIGRVVPQGGVSAVLTTGSGRFQAFATPVDSASGDTWSVADWGSLLGYPADAVTVIPVAGVLAGAGNTFFQTDVAFANRGTSPAAVDLRFSGRSGESLSRSLVLGARQTLVFPNVVGDFLRAPNGSVGYITVTPVSGEIAVTSRTYTTVAGQAATFGTGVPTVAGSQAMKRGAVRVIAGLNDAAVSTVLAQRPATFRTNFGMMETGGGSAKVRVTVRFTFPAGSKVSGLGSASRDYDLGPNQFLLVNGLTTEVLGPSRSSFGDLADVEASFQVIDGSGSVIVFTSTVDNGTGDSILRIE
ncbi:MAG TPA: hypothetical protein VMS98_11325 [Thermoanaerobaculia bacterium]|nr:hypothetical protein [Thermoanaerobaculia bacterium]